MRKVFGDNILLPHLWTPSFRTHTTWLLANALFSNGRMIYSVADDAFFLPFHDQFVVSDVEEILAAELIDTVCRCQ